MKPFAATWKGTLCPRQEIGEEGVRTGQTLELAAATKEPLEEPLGILLSLDSPSHWGGQGNQRLFSRWSEKLPTATVRPSPTLSPAEALAAVPWRQLALPSPCRALTLTLPFRESLGLGAPTGRDQTRWISAHLLRVTPCVCTAGPLPSASAG